MKINHNLSAVITNTELRKNENSVAASMEKLSSGISINHSKDNPVGMAISNMMKTQIKGLDRATENAQTFVSLLNTAEGAVAEMHSVAQRMRELAVQAANDTNTELDRESLQNEMKSLQEEINRISKDTEFNGKGLLDGTMGRKVISEKTEIIRLEGKNIPGNYKVEIVPAKPAKIVSENEIEPEWEYSGPTEMFFYAAYGDNKCDTYGQPNLSASEAIDGYGPKPDTMQHIKDICESVGITFEIVNNHAEFTAQYDGKWAERKEEDRESVPITIMWSGMSHLGFNSQELTVYGTNTQITTIPSDDGFSDDTEVITKGDNFTITDHKKGITISGNIKDGVTTMIQETIKVPNFRLPSGQIGAGEDQMLEVEIPRIDTETLGLEYLNLNSFGSSGEAIDKIDKAIQQISDHRAHIGALTNRFEYTIAYLEDNSENMNAAVSTISDTDMAEEMTEYTSQNVLVQAATSMLAQANDAPEQLLSLLQ